MFIYKSLFVVFLIFGINKLTLRIKSYSNLFKKRLIRDIMPEIRGLLKEEMPREKLMELGPSSLTNVELLAVILRVGTKDKNVLELSREILDSFSVSLISRKTYYDLLKFRGVSKAKACQIVSVFELSRRLFSYSNKDKIKLRNSQSVFNFVKGDYWNLELERVSCVFVDTKNQLLYKQFFSEGSINFSFVDIRKIIKMGLDLNSSGFFLVHNHPSGDLTPSREDIEISLKLKRICVEMDLRFLDHLIISENNYYSMFDNGDI